MYEVGCSGCGARHALSPEQARQQRVVRCSCGQFVRMDRALVEPRSDPAPAPVTASETTPKPAHRTALPSLSGALASASAGDKPPWYVDLGGSETIEMTIEQLIIARRSGKLGEGALVWRAGMPRWRPVGTLIPATSASLPPPPSPAAGGLRARSPEPAAVSLRSYERPQATLEFALEKPPAAPARTPSSSAPVRRQSDPPPGSPTPLPPAPSLGPINALGPMAPSTGSSVAATPIMATPPSAGERPPRERPPWVTASFALLLCVLASGTGALLVRSVRVDRRAVLSSDGVSQRAANGRAKLPARPPPTLVAAEPLVSTPVVDVNSLSVERKPPRAAPRASALGSSQAIALPTPLGGDDSEALDQPPAASATRPAVSKPHDGDLQPAAHATPYTTETLNEAATR